jgi:exopolysaccharide biosynthesis polyprenyl glycosylphosphotransferase
VDAAPDLAVIPDLVPVVPTGRPASAASAAPARGADAGQIAREAWIGRASICWLGSSLPLLAGGTAASSVLRLSLPAAAIWFLVVLVADGSSRERRPAFGPLARAASTTIVGLALLSALSAWLPGALPPRGALVASALLVGGASAIWEASLGRAVAGRLRVLVVGSSPAARVLADELFRTGTPCATISDVAGLPRALRHARADLVVADDDDRERVAEVVLAAADPHLAVAGPADLLEHLAGRVPVRQLGPAWFASALHLYRRPYAPVAKRLFDVVVATLGLLVTAPLLAAVAVALACSGGPVLYRQERRGQGGLPFTILKFRTMVEHSEQPGEPVWAAEDDPRVTRIGRLLRRTRIDELPQLWNVLAGTMSVVGPRPERPELADRLAESVPFWAGRTLLKPGITGWAQINDGYAADCEAAEAKLAYDLWYLRHRSLLVDVAICARTFARLTAGAR